MPDQFNKNLYSYLSYVIGRLSSITRYSTRRFIVGQTVMEHIGSVGFISMVLSEYLNNHGVRNDPGKVIALALIHDVPEVISGDLPHDTKYDYGEVSKGLRRQLHDLEQMTMKYALAKLKDGKTSEKIYSLFEEYNERKSVESRIVKIADLYDVILYTQREMSMGNKAMIGEYKSTLRELSPLIKGLRGRARPSRKPA
jgi:5'-deoxynucleotidase